METQKINITGYPNYFATNDGYVFSKARSKQCGHVDSKPQFLKEKRLKGRANKKGYLHIILYNDTGSRSFRVHRLIWEAFKGKIPEGMEINHIEPIKTDNRLSNLECVTHTDNMRHAEKLGLITRKVGEENKASKLKECDIDQIFTLRFHGWTYKEIAYIYRVNPATIGRVLNGDTWKHLNTVKR